MKTIRTILITTALFVSAATTHAALIDLTPGGFRSDEPLPRVVEQWFARIYDVSIVYAGNAHIDQNQVVTWEDMPINGSNANVTPIGTSDFLSWQLTPQLSSLKYIMTAYYDFNTDVLVANLYRVTPNSGHVGYGLVYADRISPVTGIAFYFSISPHRFSFQRPKTQSEMFKLLYEQTQAQMKTR